MYPDFGQLDALVAERLVSKRPHPKLPLFIYNYTAAAQGLGISGWSETLQDCRGLILDHSGNIVARGFRKFWNMETVLDKIPTETNFTVWEKLDGSLAICFWYEDNLVVATRGSFESDQAKWAANHITTAQGSSWSLAGLIRPGFSYLCEIIFPENRIVVDYGDRQDIPLLAVLDVEGKFQDHLFGEWPASKARRFNGMTDLRVLSSLIKPEEEGFVIRWPSGFQCKAKGIEYVRLHRLITQCSTRTIWELLRSGKDTAELIDRVPAEFGDWVKTQIRELTERHNGLLDWMHGKFQAAPQDVSRKEFADYAKQQDQPGLLFAMLDAKPIEDMCWRLVEPKWATPFRGDADE